MACEAVEYLTNKLCIHHLFISSPLSALAERSLKVVEYYIIAYYIWCDKSLIRDFFSHCS